MSLVLDQGEEQIVDVPFCGTATVIEAEDPAETPVGSNAATGYVLVPLECLRPHPDNNLLWEDEPIDDLLVAIQKSGYLSPLIVMMNYDKEGNFDGTYTILGGHRRFRAACTLGYMSVMCKTINPGDSELSALGVLWSDNATCRTMTAADKLRAGIILFQRVPEGGNKAQVLAQTCGMSYDTAEKIMNAAAKVMRAMEENPEQADNIQKDALELAKTHGISKVSNEFKDQSYNHGGGRSAPPKEKPEPTRWLSENEYNETLEATAVDDSRPRGVNYFNGIAREEVQKAIDEQNESLPMVVESEAPDDNLIWKCFKNLIKSLPVDHQEVLSTLAAPVNLRELWRAIGYNPPDSVKDWKLSDLQTTDGFKPDTNLKRMGVKEDVVTQLLIGG